MIFNRCKCAERMKNKIPCDFYNDTEELMELLADKDSICEGLEKDYNEHLRSKGEKSACEGCPIKENIPIKKFRPIVLNTDHFDPMPKVPEFPINLIPSPFSDYIKQTADSMYCPIDFPALAMMCYWAGVVGSKQEIVIKHDYIIKANMWGIVVGSPSSKKSPSMGKVDLFTQRLEGIARDRYDEQCALYDALSDEEKKSEPEPIKKRFKIQDATKEAVGLLLKDNPHGVIGTYDELKSWLDSFDRYAKNSASSERSWWISLWNGSDIVVDRAVGKSYFVKSPTFSMFGNLVPDYLRGLKDSNSGFVDDGLSARYLYSYPERMKLKFNFDNNIKQKTYDEVFECFDWMTSTFVEKNNYDLNTMGYVKLDSAGKCQKIWLEWYNDIHAKQIEKFESSDLEFHWSKLDAYVAKIALMIHTMLEASSKKMSDRLDPSSLEKAIKMVEYYFKKHIKKIYHYRNLSQNEKTTQALLKWLKNQREDVFAMTDINQRFKPGKKYLPINLIATICRDLESMGNGLCIGKSMNFNKDNEKGRTHFYLFRDVGE